MEGRPLSEDDVKEYMWAFMGKQKVMVRRCEWYGAKKTKICLNVMEWTPESWWKCVNNPEDFLADTIDELFEKHPQFRPLQWERLFGKKKAVTVRSNAMKALIIVDVQNDFCPGGALAVKDGDEIVPIINEMIQQFLVVVTSQDWHPEDHFSFAADGEPKYVDGSWPRHCVAGTLGAMIHPALRIGHGLGRGVNHLFVHKGMSKLSEQYSAFDGVVFDWEKEAKGLPYTQKDSLDARLRKAVEEVYICGLATDYCVKATAMDAVHHGFRTYVYIDACKAVSPETEAAAIAEMKAAGVVMMTSAAAKETA